MGLSSSRESVEFGVRVIPKTGGYLIDVWHKYGKSKQPQDFAKIDCSDLWTGLQMALPYMAHAAEPDPFASLLADAGVR